MNWVQQWWPTDEIGILELLDPDKWYKPESHGVVSFWTPPPAAGDAAAECLTTSIHSRSWNFHVFVIPELWTGIWRKTLYKAGDFVVKLPPVSQIWDKSQHEHLTFVFCLPLARTHPWRFKHREELVNLDWQVRRMWKKDLWATGSILRQLCLQAWSLRAMPEVLVS